MAQGEGRVGALALPTHPVVLVSRHCCELCLGEDEGLEVLLGIALAVLARVHKDHMQARLVTVHGVEDDLQGVGGHRAQCPGSSGHRGPSPHWASSPLPPPARDCESLQLFGRMMRTLYPTLCPVALPAAASASGPPPPSSPASSTRRSSPRAASWPKLLA